MPECVKCGRTVTSDEMGLNKKYISRMCSEYMCISCFAQYFRVKESVLSDKIKELKEMGCGLFQ